jgi:hypothetical protein
MVGMQPNVVVSAKETLPTPTERISPEPQKPAEPQNIVKAPAPAESVDDETPEAPPLAEPTQPAKMAQKGDLCGTAVEFVASPKLAAQQAIREQKLVFVLHVSGDFEDPDFT